MTEHSIHGHTKTGKAITDADIEKYAAEAEAGYDVDELLSRRPKRGRPSLGTAPASVESVRLDPELQHDLVERATLEGRTTSAVIRDALRSYLSHSGS
jgi:hypothetical protein